MSSDVTLPRVQSIFSPPLLPLAHRSAETSMPGSGSVGNGGGGPSSLDGATTATGGHSPRPRDPNNTGDGGRSELGAPSPRSPLARSQGVSGGGSGGASSAGGGGGGPGLGGQPGVRQRGVQLTAVTFAANAPVMAVGKRRKFKEGRVCGNYDPLEWRDEGFRQSGEVGGSEVYPVVPTPFSIRGGHKSCSRRTSKIGWLNRPSQYLLRRPRKVARRGKLIRCGSRKRLCSNSLGAFS